MVDYLGYIYLEYDKNTLTSSNKLSSVIFRGRSPWVWSMLYVCTLYLLDWLILAFCIYNASVVRRKTNLKIQIGQSTTKLNRSAWCQAIGKNWDQIISWTNWIWSIFELLAWRAYRDKQTIKQTEAKFKKFDKQRHKIANMIMIRASTRLMQKKVKENWRKIYLFFDWF